MPDTRMYPSATGAIDSRQISSLIATMNVTFGVQTMIRSRVSVAQVNAGFVLLPALPTVRWRLFDIMMIAIGGAASGATDVRVLGTSAGSSVALGIAAIAGLTQSTVLRLGTPFATAGTASIVALANGASFLPMDANTSITAGKTGGSLATSTFVDFLLSYVADPQ